MSHLPDPGFYKDPDDPSQERWWNGNTWVGQVQAATGRPPLPLDPIPAVGAPAVRVEVDEASPVYQPGDVVNGHLLAADGQWYAVSGSRGIPPADARQPLNNGFLWALVAVAPIVSFLLAFTSSTDVAWLLLLTGIGLNTVFAFFDEKEVKTARPEVKPVTFIWGFMLVPVYLWLRRRDTKENQLPVIAWAAALVLSFMPSFLAASATPTGVAVPDTAFTSPTTPTQTYRPARVALGDATPDEFGFVTVPLTITNPAANSGPCSFYMTVTAESSDGSTLYDTGAATVMSLAPGQRYNTEVMFTEQVPPDAVVLVRDTDCYPS